MSWYIHPSKQLRDDELPPELVVTNRDGSIEQVYVPYDYNLRTENTKLRELVRDLYYETKSPSNHATQVEIRMSELGIEVPA